MTHSLRKTLLGSVGAFVVTLGLAASGWSMSHSGSALAGEGSDHASKRVEHKVAHLAKKLDLSKQQKLDITQLLLDAHSDVATDKTRMKELKDALKEQRKAFDAGAAKLAADELGDLMARMAYQRTNTQAQVYQLLTQSQRAEMDSMMEKREKHRRHRRSHMRGMYI